MCLALSLLYRVDPRRETEHLVSDSDVKTFDVHVRLQADKHPLEVSPPVKVAIDLIEDFLTARQRQPVRSSRS